MRCTYDPAENEEAQFQRAFASKNAATESPRPDALMIAKRWSHVITKQGLDFSSVTDDRIKAFNVDKHEGYGIVSHEIAFLKAYQHQSPEFEHLLGVHWQHFKVNESAVPPKRLALADLSPDTKIMRCEKTSALWQHIFTWTPDSNVLWLRREIGTFLRNIKDAQRSGKKINLRSNAKMFRPRSDNPSSHVEVCVFVHFLPEFKAHTTEKQ